MRKLTQDAVDRIIQEQLTKHQLQVPSFAREAFWKVVVGAHREMMNLELNAVPAHRTYEEMKRFEEEELKLTHQHPLTQLAEERLIKQMENDIAVMLSREELEKLRKPNEEVQKFLDVIHEFVCVDERGGRTLTWGRTYEGRMLDKNGRIVQTLAEAVKVAVLADDTGSKRTYRTSYFALKNDKNVQP